MSQEQHPPGGEQQEAPPRTPFDNPFFLPALLWIGAAWFGYDIVTNAEAYQEWPNFNRGGFALLSIGAIYSTWRGIQDLRRSRRSDSSGGE